MGKKKKIIATIIVSFCFVEFLSFIFCWLGFLSFHHFYGWFPDFLFRCNTTCFFFCFLFLVSCFMFHVFFLTLRQAGAFVPGIVVL